MKKIFKRKSVSVEPQADSDMASLINRMQQQITSLEAKIDTLISKSSDRPSRGDNYSRPFKRFDNSGRFSRGGKDNNYPERSFTKAVCTECKKECEVPFRPTGDRPVYCKECFSKRNPREENFAKGRNFDKPQGRENRKPGGIKSLSFRRRKERA